MQTDAFKAASCEHISTDKASGAKIDRSGIAEALGLAGKGDSLVIWKLDRLGRSMKGLVDLAADLSAGSIKLRSLTDGIDTWTHTGRMLFHNLASIAEMERELLRERTMAGLVPLHRNFDCLSVSRIERGQVGLVHLNSDAPSRAGLA